MTHVQPWIVVALVVAVLWALTVVAAVAIARGYDDEPRDVRITFNDGPPAPSTTLVLRA